MENKNKEKIFKELEYKFQQDLREITKLMKNDRYNISKYLKNYEVIEKNFLDEVRKLDMEDLLDNQKDINNYNKDDLDKVLIKYIGININGLNKQLIKNIMFDIEKIKGLQSYILVVTQSNVYQNIIRFGVLLGDKNAKHSFDKVCEKLNITQAEYDRLTVFSELDTKKGVVFVDDIFNLENINLEKKISKLTELENSKINFYELFKNKNYYNYQQLLDKLNERNLTTKTGIYAIYIKNENLTETIPIYVGQAKDIFKRWKQHKLELIKSFNGEKSYRKYDKINYYMNNKQITYQDLRFIILEECLESQLNEKEYFYIDKYQSELCGFNSTKGNNRIKQNLQNEKLIKCQNIINTIINEITFSKKPIKQQNIEINSYVKLRQFLELLEEKGKIIEDENTVDFLFWQIEVIGKIFLDKMNTKNLEEIKYVNNMNYIRDFLINQFKLNYPLDFRISWINHYPYLKKEEEINGKDRTN